MICVKCLDYVIISICGEDFDFNVEFMFKVLFKWCVMCDVVFFVFVRKNVEFENSVVFFLVSSSCRCCD